MCQIPGTIPERIIIPDRFIVTRVRAPIIGIIGSALLILPMRGIRDITEDSVGVDIPAERITVGPTRTIKDSCKTTVEIRSG